MTEQVTEYICLSCGGPLHFDAQSGKLKCDYCASLYTVEEAKAYFAEKNKAVQDEAVISEDESYWTDDENMKSYKCNSCGAEMICDDTTAATSCPYCGNPAVMPQQFKGMMRPKYVIPFKVDKSAVKEKLSRYYKGKLLLPGSFTKGNHIDEIKGVYVPFWLYSGTVDAEMMFDAKKVDTQRTSKEEITKTRYYNVHRKGTISFDKIPTDASTAMPDDLMDSIEPYDYKDLKGFEMEYLPGYLADKYDVTKEDSIDRARKRVENSAADEIKKTVEGYDNVNEIPLSRHMKYRAEKQEYAMLPVWILSTIWNGKNYMFAVNGQTGKMTGNLPIDRMKQILAFLICFLIPFGITALLLGTEPKMLIIAAVLGLAFGLLAAMGLTANMKPVNQKNKAAEYMKGGKNALHLSLKTDHFLKETVQRKPINQNHQNK